MYRFQGDMMGKILNVNPDELLATQDNIKRDTVKFILKTMVRGKFDKLPAIPIVKKEDNNIIVLDGHNLLCVYGMLGKKCDVYVADDAFDTVNGRDKIDFDLAPIMTIKELRIKYISEFDMVKR